AFLRAARYKEGSGSPGIAPEAPRALADASPPPHAAAQTMKRRLSISVERIEAYPHAKGWRHVFIYHAFGVLQNQRHERQASISVLGAQQIVQIAAHRLQGVTRLRQLVLDAPVYPAFVFGIYIGARHIELAH